MTLCLFHRRAVHKVEEMMDVPRTAFKMKHLSGIRNNGSVNKTEFLNYLFDEFVFPARNTNGEHFHDNFITLKCFLVS